MSTTETAYVHTVKFNTVKVGDEDRRVMNARVNIPRSRFNEKTREYEDTGSFWSNLSLWGRAAEHLEGKIKPGANVLIVGRFSTESWQDKESGETRSGMSFQAQQVALLARSIETVSFKQRQNNGSGNNENAEGPGEDDIPF